MRMRHVIVSERLRCGKDLPPPLHQLLPQQHHQLLAHVHPVKSDMPHERILQKNDAVENGAQRQTDDDGEGDPERKGICIVRQLRESGGVDGRQKEGEEASEGAEGLGGAVHLEHAEVFEGFSEETLPLTDAGGFVAREADGFEDLGAVGDVYDFAGVEGVVEGVGRFHGSFRLFPSHGRHPVSRTAHGGQGQKMKQLVGTRQQFSHDVVRVVQRVEVVLLPPGIALLIVPVPGRVRQVNLIHEAFEDGDLLQRLLAPPE
mmetsp:Transcript_22640/g.51877  ORF Transcript_22640/g.51877 Transcript_22640/m.51877 type:complete len:260 (-) Transcript_22640:432-1211(-)